MKPMFVLFNGGANPIAFNTNAIRSISVDKNRSKATVTLVDGSVNVAVSEGLIQRLEREVKSRYNFIAIDKNGVGLNRQDVSKNPLVKMSMEDGATAFVWPRAINSIQIDDNTVTVQAFDGLDLDVELEKRLTPDQIGQLRKALHLAEG